jgi:hypothetical protein
VSPPTLPELIQQAQAAGYALKVIDGQCYAYSPEQRIRDWIRLGATRAEAAETLRRMGEVEP